VDEYYRMAEAGIIASDARVELIEGELLDMAPMKSRHAAMVARLNTLLLAAVGTRAQVRCQLPLRLDAHSEPEPDLLVVVPRADFYAAAHPTAADVLLLVEVSDSSSRYDREIKLPLYARHGVGDVWIVDLDSGLLRRYHRPVAAEYAEINATATPGVLPLPGVDGASIDLTGILA
jgi:Uma2 family endonuclease